MLDVFFSSRLCRKHLLKIILLTAITLPPVTSYSFEQQELQFNHHEYEWVSRYFNSLDDDTPIEEVVDFLINLRAAIEMKGYNPPPLSDLFLQLVGSLDKNHIDIDKDALEEIYNEIQLRESALQEASFKFALGKGDHPNIFEVKHKHKNDKHDKHDKKGKVNSKSVFGFLKALSGALMCIIPVPAIQVAGVGLVVNGINDIVDGAREQGDENEKKEPKFNPPAEYDPLNEKDKKEMN